MNPRDFIYIAGPYRGKPGVNGDHMSNCHDAMAVWHHFWQHKVHAICPHWSFSQQLLTPLCDLDWLAFTMAQMTLCKAVYRMPGRSSGSDAEVMAAKDMRIPVFEDLAEAVAFMRGDHEEAGGDQSEGCCGEADCWRCGLVGPGVPLDQSQFSIEDRHNACACVRGLADCP